MLRGSWLFVRGPESIRVLRPHDHAIIVLGPGAERDVHEFRNEAEIQTFQVSVAEKLSAAGWMLLGENVDRRREAERRASGRGTPDRRRVESSV